MLAKQKNKFLTPRIAIHFCPFCGLIADVKEKGDWCICPHCELGFRVYTSRALPENLSGSRQKDMCKNKFPHASLRMAYDVWLEIKDKEFHNNSPMTIYLCELCGQYHLGHQPKEDAAYRSRLFWTIEEAKEELDRWGKL